jgi:hypothetical protein
MKIIKTYAILIMVLVASLLILQYPHLEVRSFVTQLYDVWKDKEETVVNDTVSFVKVVCMVSFVKTEVLDAEVICITYEVFRSVNSSEAINWAIAHADWINLEPATYFLSSSIILKPNTTISLNGSNFTLPP